MRPIENTLGASWIAIRGQRELGRVDTVLFQKQITVREGETLTVRVSACSRYKLYVNGDFIAFGPCKGGDGYQFFDTVELPLKTGENEVLFEVVSFPHVTNGSQVGGPDWAVSLAPYAALAVIGESSMEQNISTGITAWKAARCAVMTPVRNTTASWLGYTEHADLAESAVNWDDAEVCEDLFATFWGVMERFPAYERPIPMLELHAPKALTESPRGEAVFSGDGLIIGAESCFTVDLDAGEETTAFVTLCGKGGKGAEIRIRYAEAYLHKNKDGVPEKGIRTPGDDGIFEGFADEVLPCGGEFSYSPFWFRTFRYIRLEVKTGAEPLTLSALTCRITRYPLVPVTAVKEDDSGFIRDIWDISLRTLRCCMHETFEDCPYYEQMQYTMDTRLQMLFVYRTAGDTRMPMRTLYDYHASQLPSGILQSRYPCNQHQVIPAFSLHWIFMLRDYFWQTGDKTVLRTYFGTMDRVLGYFRDHRTDGGLAADLGYWEFIDWVDDWQGGVPDCKGAEGNHNMVYAYALGVAAEIARALGYDGIAADYEAEKAEVLALLYERFYDKARGLYRYRADEEKFCQHTQVWAVMAGAGDDAFRRALMERVYEAGDALLPCSFPMQFYLFRAYESVGMYEKTEALWELWKKIPPQALTTIPETPIGARSDCHAWGSLMLYEYPAKILGVQPAEPGWKTVLVKPVALYLGKAEGRACVPDGSVDVKWCMTAGRMELTLTLDTDLPVRAEMPDGSVQTIQGRGKTVVIAE
ncbi:MAG: hypothetical protein MJ175_00760 [Clostridia bacterium]|nr:hypothetical protein [Clostridia bacterium]